MGAKGPDLDSVHFGELVGVLQEADDIGILLRGHLWIEVLVEYAARGSLKHPNAIRWDAARFEHKLALAEATGAIDADVASALRGFNGLRNRLAHDLDFGVSEADVKTFIGRLSPEHKERISVSVDQQLDIYRQVKQAEADGIEVEFEPSLAWYPRVMTPTRAYLFGFVVEMARTLAFAGAFGAIDRREIREPAAMLQHLDSELERLTGGLFRFPKRAE